MPGIAIVEIEGLDKLLAKLNTKKYAGALEASLRSCLSVIYHHVARYPPATEANEPPITYGRWYERGFGTKYKRKKDGGITEYPTSQALGRSWTIRVTSGLSGEVGSRVSYGPYVQGAEQAEFHKRTGWSTIYQVAAEVAPTLTRMLTVVVNRLLGGAE